MEFKRFTKKNLLINTLLVVAYLVWENFAGGIRSEHYFLVVFWLVLFYASGKTRRFILGFSVFIIFWIIYDSMRILPNYEVSTPHIREPYEIEKTLFGIRMSDGIVTPNEYFSIVHTKFLDLLSGLFYINWMPVPLGFGVYLYLTNKRLFFEYSLAFLFVNLLGFAIYYLYPAAPPWYVKLYGFDLHIGVPGNRAGLERFDELVGIPVFESIYNKNANVLAAIPSLHAAYPVIVLFYAVRNKMSRVAIGLFAFFMLGVWFSAVYSSHHYIIDVLSGVMLALIALFIFNRLIQNQTINRKITRIVEQI